MKVIKNRNCHYDNMLGESVSCGCNSDNSC